MMRKLIAVLGAVVVVALIAGAGGGSGRNFKASLSGSEEVPTAVVTDTSGKASFHANNAETEIRFHLKINNGDDILAVAGAHIHCGAAGTNGPVAAFLAGAVPPAGFDGKVHIRATLTGASVLPTDCGTTIAELLGAMQAGNTYVNVHSAGNPGGEVRGQIG